MNNETKFWTIPNLCMAAILIGVVAAILLGKL